MQIKTQLNFTKTHIALALKTATLLIATAALFFQDFAMIFNDALQSESASHLLAVPFLLAYLIYRKRKMIRAVIPIGNRNEPKETRHLPTIAGILLLTIAVLTYWHGSHTFTPIEYHMLALPILVAGLVLTIFNYQTLRQLAFPIAFLIFLMPPPSEILYNLGATMSIISSEASNAIVNFIGIKSTITNEFGNPAIIMTRPDGTIIPPFTVDIACSGIYSLIGFLIFATFIAYTTRDKPWKKLIIFIIGLPLIYLLNILRITTILLIGYSYSTELALQVFHLLGGWILIFLGTLLLLTISEKIFKIQIFSKPKETCLKHNPTTESNMGFCLTCGKINPKPIKLNKIDIAKITAIILTIFLLTYIQAPVFALTQGPPILAIGTPKGEVLTEALPQVVDYSLSFCYRNKEFEKTAKQDMSLVYMYIPSNESEELIWVTIEIASTQASLHRWEVCLITWPLSHGYQSAVTQIELKDIQILQNPPIISRYFVFQDKKTNITQAVLYWYETATFTINSTAQQKHVKISLIAYPQNSDNLLLMENQLKTIATKIANYWQPIKTWSLITMTITQNASNLTIIAGALLTATTAYYFIENKRQRKANTLVYHKLSTANKKIIDAIQKTEKTTTPTLNNILMEHEKTAQKQISFEQILQTLNGLEKTGIVKTHIINKQDEPIQAWKTQIDKPHNKQ